MTAIAKSFENKNVDHTIVYITEAHPSDGWKPEWSPYKGVAYATSMEDRLATARMYAKDANIETKVLIDGMDDVLEHSYEARPERLYVVSAGKVLWRCGLGPFEYDPAGLKAFLTSQIG